MGQTTDPLVSKKRGKSMHKVVIERRCSVCKQIGHTKPKCPNAAQLKEDITGDSNEFAGHDGVNVQFFDSISFIVRSYLDLVGLHLPKLLSLTYLFPTSITLLIIIMCWKHLACCNIACEGMSQIIRFLTMSIVNVYLC